MKTHFITVDVYAGYSDTPPRYRVFVDGELLTERDFIWAPHEVFIRENIVVNLEPGQHKLLVEQVGTNGIIRAKNVRVDEQSVLTWFTTTE